jgi:ABC-type amino acid transport substrate-binding protein
VEFAGRLLPSDILVMVPTASPLTDLKELNQNGKRIGVAPGSSIARVARRSFPRASVQEQDEPTEAVQSGGSDGCVVDAVTKIFMERHPALRLVRHPDRGLVVLAREYGHPAIRPGDARFLNWIGNWLHYHEAQGTIGYWLDWWHSFMVD